YGGPAPHVAPSDRQSSLRTKSVLGEISIAPSAPQRPAFVQPSLCGGFAPHKLLIRFEPENAPSAPLAACGFGERPSKINTLCSRFGDCLEIGGAGGEAVVSRLISDLG